METSQSLEKTNKMPWPIYAEVFELEEKLGNEKNWAFSCKVCVGKKIIHASKTSTANLRKHISVSFYLFSINPHGISVILQQYTVILLKCYMWEYIFY